MPPMPSDADDDEDENDGVSEQDRQKQEDELCDTIVKSYVKKQQMSTSPVETLAQQPPKPYVLTLSQRLKLRGFIFIFKTTKTTLFSGQRMTNIIPFIPMVLC